MKAPRARPPDDISPGDFFTRWIVDTAASDPARRERLRGTEAVIEFALEGNPGGTYTVEIRDGGIHGREGGAEHADLRVSLAVDTWRALNAGTLSAPEALLHRKLKLHGNFLLALKLHLVLG